MITERMQELAGVEVSETIVPKVYLVDKKKALLVQGGTSQDVAKRLNARWVGMEAKKFDSILSQGKDVYIVIDPYQEYNSHDRILYVYASQKLAKKHANQSIEGPMGT